MKEWFYLWIKQTCIEALHWLIIIASMSLLDIKFLMFMNWTALLNTKGCNGWWRTEQLIRSLSMMWFIYYSYNSDPENFWGIFSFYIWGLKLQKISSFHFIEIYKSNMIILSYCMWHFDLSKWFFILSYTKHLETIVSGITLISLALCADGAIGNVQEKTLKQYSAASGEMVSLF